MKKLISLLFVLLSLPVFSQNTTAVSGSHVVTADVHVPVQSGTICFQPVVSGNGQQVQNASGYAVGGGMFAVGAPACSTITNGSYPAVNVASSDHTSPLGIQYQIKITDDLSGSSWTIGTTPITGNTWTTDTFAPTGVSTLPATPGPSTVSGTLTINGASTVSGDLTVTGSVHGVADNSLTTDAWKTPPQPCPAGFSSSSFDVHGNALNCTANSAQTSGSASGAIAQAPSGNQMITLQPGSLQRIGSPASSSEFDENGVLSSPNIKTKGPKIDATHPDFGAGSGCANVADPTGVLDSSCAINAAIAYSVNNMQSNGSTPAVYLPVGTYLLNSEIVAPMGTHLIGDGRTQTILQVNNQWQNAIKITRGTNPGNSPSTLLENIGINGKGHLNGGDAIECLGATFVSMENMQITNWGGRGFNALFSCEQGSSVNAQFVFTRFDIDMQDQNANEWYWWRTNQITSDRDSGQYTRRRGCPNGVCTPNNSNPASFPAWQPNMQVHAGDFISDGTTNCSGGPCIQKAQTDGVTGASITFTGGDGTLTNDGSGATAFQWLNDSNRTLLPPMYECGTWIGGNNVTFMGGSIKSMPDLCGFKWTGSNGLIANHYFEGSFGGMPLIEAPVVIGGFAESGTLAGTMTTTQLTIPMSLTGDALWLPWITNPSDVSFVNTEVPTTFHISCADFVPSGTSPCGQHPTIQQGQFETVMCHVLSSDGNMYCSTRCAAGSTACVPGSGTGVAWSASAGDVWSRPVGAGTRGFPTILNSHFNSNSGPRPSTGYDGDCSNFKIGGYLCGNPIGAIPDGREFNLPGLPQAINPVPNNPVSSAANFQDIFYDAPNSTDGGNSLYGSVFQIPLAGSVRVDGVSRPTSVAPPATSNLGSLFFSATDPQKPIYYATNSGYSVFFGDYPSGSAIGSYEDSALGTLMIPQAHIFKMNMMPTGTDATNSYLAEQFANGYMLQDTPPNGTGNAHPLNRFGLIGAPAVTQGYVTADGWNGSSWNNYFTADNNGLHSNTVNGPSIGMAQNFVANSVNPGITGWTTGGPTWTFTAGQPDPFGGTGAVKWQTDASVANKNYSSFASSALSSTAGPFFSGVWLKGCAGGEIVNYGLQVSGNTTPPIATTALTTSWQKFSSIQSGPILTTTPRFEIGTGTSQPGICFYVFNPQANAGSSLAPYQATSGSSVMTPQSAVQANIVTVNGNPAIGATTSTPTGTCTANGFITTNVGGTSVKLATCAP